MPSIAGNGASIDSWRAAGGSTQWGLPFLSPRPDPRRALHCWQRCLHRLVAGYGKYWGCVPWRKPHIASPAYLHRSPPRLPLRPFSEARNPHLQRPRHPLCKKGEGSGCVLTGSFERCCRLEEHADLCFVLQLTALVLLDLYSFLESVSHRLVYRSTGRQQGCSSSSTRSTFPLCLAHVQQRQPRLFSNTSFVGSSYALSYYSITRFLTPFLS